MASLKGNAGCNDSFGPYETNDNAISMDPFGSTRKACQEPEGVMEQETLCLQALESAASYRIDGREGAPSTGLTFVKRDAQELKEAGNLLMLTGVQPHVIDILKRSGIMDIIGEENVFPAQPGYGASDDAALEAAEAWIAKQPNSQPDNVS